MNNFISGRRSFFELSELVTDCIFVEVGPVLRFSSLVARERPVTFWLEYVELQVMLASPAVCTYTQTARIASSYHARTIDALTSS